MANSSMLPPKFHDWNRWLQFRRIINETFKLKQIINSDKFKFAIGMMILFTTVNSLLSIYSPYHVFDVFDDILILFYVFEIVIKIIGLGPENFFKDPWNKLDFALITIGLILELAPTSIVPHNSDQLFKITRLFRVTGLFKLIFDKSKL